jgi:hypothetical protein
MKIIYALTTEAHRAAVLAGSAGPRTRHLEGAVTTEALTAVSDRLCVLPSGDCYVTGRLHDGLLRSGGGPESYDGQTCVALGRLSRAPADLADLLAILAAERERSEATRTARAAAQRARAEAAIGDVLAAPDQRWYDADGRWRHTYDGPLPIGDDEAREVRGIGADPRVLARRAEVDGRRQAHIRARETERLAAAEQALAAYAAGQAPWPGYDQSWLEAHAEHLPSLARAREVRAARAQAAEDAARAREAALTAHLRTRLEALAPDVVSLWASGAVCRESVIATIAEAVIGPVAGPAVSTRTCADTDCPCGWEDRRCLPLDVAARVQRMVARLPAGSTVEGYRRGRSHRDAAEPRYWIGRVIVPDGPLTLTRDVRL